MYLLDTNVISELRKPRPHGGVVAWLESINSNDLYLSAVTLGEIQAGIELTREQDPLKAAEIEAWADALACAIQHKLTVVTRNVGDFERFKVAVFNPFTALPT
jgi:toxin FitB